MIEWLLQSDLFANLSVRQGRHILNHFSRHKIKKSKVLFQPNKRAQYFFIILSGHFKIETLNQTGDLHLLAYAKPGEVLGETALLTGTAHSGKVTAILDSEVLRLGSKQFRELLLKYPQLAINLGQIEATRLRKRMKGATDELLKRRFIAHYTGFDPIESHYIGLNLAAAMSQAMGKPVAYLHLSTCNTTPIATLNIKISENRLEKAVSKLRDYRSFNVSDYMVKHPSGLHVLPSVPGKLPIQLLKATDLPRLLATLGTVYSVIFMELGSENLQSSRAQAAIRQADQVIVGTTQYERSYKKVKKDFTQLQKKIGNLPPKTHVYLNSVDCLDCIPDLTIRRRRLLLSQIESGLKHPIDFRLQGSMPTIHDYYRDDLLVMNQRAQKVSVSMRSLGRWLVDRSIGIAFGGGGARSLAEIGVLKVLEEENIHFDEVTGTSMGALVGALYAMDVTPDEMLKKFAEILPNDSVFLDYNIPLISFFRERKKNRLLKKAFGKTRIEDLSIPFTAVAVDLLSGQEVHINRGLVWRAVRASMSLPVIFPPVKYKGMYLIDGGALNVVPASILKQNRVHKVLGINCTPLEDDSIANYIKQTDLFALLRPGKNFFKNLSRFFALLALIFRRPPILQIANRSMNLEGAELIRSKAHLFDILLNPDVKSFGLFDFHRRDELFENGYKEAKKRLREIKQALLPKI